MLKRDNYRCVVVLIIRLGGRVACRSPEFFSNQLPQFCLLPLQSFAAGQCSLNRAALISLISVGGVIGFVP